MSVIKFREPLVTDAGMHCIWDPLSFSHVIDYNSWEKEFLEDFDIIRNIKEGSFVPIYIHSDGTFEFEVRVGSMTVLEELSEREKKYLVVSSEKYRFNSKGKVCISGIEYISNTPDSYVGSLDIPKGEYSVNVYIIGWDDEPGMKEQDGTPKAEALPDFIVIMNPTLDQKVYRVELDTFPNPGE